MPRSARSSRGVDEVSAGGVVVRGAAGHWEFALVRAGRHWGLPKGHLEAGETPEHAALREIAEELGLSSELLTIIGTLPRAEYMYRRNGRLTSKVVHHFLVLATGDTTLARQESEIDEAAWLPLEEAVARSGFEATRTALVAAADSLSAQKA